MAKAFRLAVAYNQSDKTKRPPMPDWLHPSRDLSQATKSMLISHNYWTKIYWATPPWISKAQITQMKHIYLSAPDGYHVDHIVPLKHDLVCGLHVPWNLQVLPGKVNIYKSNNYWPDSPFTTTDLFNEHPQQDLLFTPDYQLQWEGSKQTHIRPDFNEFQRDLLLE